MVGPVHPKVIESPNGNHSKSRAAEPVATDAKSAGSANRLSIAAARMMGRFVAAGKDDAKG
jgi:hypothetical protein